MNIRVVKFKTVIKGEVGQENSSGESGGKYIQGRDRPLKSPKAFVVNA